MSLGFPFFSVAGGKCLLSSTPEVAAFQRLAMNGCRNRLNIKHFRNRLFQWLETGARQIQARNKVHIFNTEIVYGFWF